MDIKVLQKDMIAAMKARDKASKGINFSIDSGGKESRD